MTVRARPACVALGALLVSSCQQPPAVPPPIAAPAAPPADVPAARAVSPWRPVAIPPAITRTTFGRDTPEGLLTVDDSGARWLFPNDGALPRSVEVLDVQPLPTRRWDDVLGLLVIAGNRQIYRAKTALGPLEPLATLPEGSDPKTFQHLEGVHTVRAKRGVLVSNDGTSWSLLPSLAGFDPLQAVVDGRGRGVGLFAPETVAHTSDRGASWTVVPTPELRVESLTTLAGRPVLTPAGRRDRFPRDVDLETGALARVFVPPAASPEERRAAAKKRGEDLASDGHPLGFRKPRRPKGASAGAAALAAPTLRARYVLEQNEHDPESAATDGNRALILPSSGLTLRYPGTPPLVGTLGEGAVPLGGPELEDCGPRTGAICGELVALSCKTRLVIYRGKSLLASFPTQRPTAVGFDAEGRLISFERDALSKRSTVARYDLTVVPATMTTSEVEDVPATLPVFVGGCQKPALWVVGRTHAARWEGDRFGPNERVPDRVVPVGVDHERQLVVTTPSARALTFVPSRVNVEIGTRSTGSVSFSEDGRHALVVNTPRRVLASNDGGKSFHPIAAPAGGTCAVLCGKDRCQLGSGAYREGFVDDESYVAPAAALPAADAPPPSPPPPKALPPVMRCTAEPAAFAGAPVATAGLSPRVGTAAFSGLDAAEGPQRRAIFADASGQAKVVTMPAGPARRPKDGDDTEELLVAGTPAITKRTERRGYSQVATDYRWDAATPLRRYLEPDTFRSRLASPDLFSEKALAAIGDRGRLLIWGAAPPIERPYPTLGRHSGHGVFVEDAAGTLHVAHEAGETDVRVVVAPREGVAVERTFVARRQGVRENAVGLLEPTSPGDPWSVVLSELVEDDATELRIHALGPDLALGPPTIVPGTRAPADHLMQLPSCGPSPSGALVRTFTRAHVSFQVPSSVEGYLQRFLRVTPRGACVERTMLGPDRLGLAANVVVVGNGGLGSSQRHGGLRCEPLITTPLPRSPTKIVGVE